MKMAWILIFRFGIIYIYFTVWYIGKFFTGKPGFSKKQADLFFPPDFADDFPVAMQVSSVVFHSYAAT